MSRIEKGHIFFVLIISLLGISSSYLMMEIWESYNPDFNLAFKVLITYLFAFYIFSKLKFKSFSKKIIFNKNKIINIFILDLIFFVCCIYSIYNFLNVEYLYRDVAQFSRFSTFINAILIFVPTLNYYLNIKKKKYYCYLLIFLACLVFFLSKTRFSIIFLFFLILIISDQSFFRLKNLLLMAAILISVIFFRSDSSDELFSDDLVVLVTSISGSEFRDGISISKYFSEYELKEIRQTYFYSLFLTAIPGWSLLGIVDPGEIRKNLIAVQYANKLNLSDIGISGIRVGLIWEFYLLFKYIGVIFLALFNSTVFKFHNYFLKDDFAKFFSFFLCFIPFYSIVGQTNMVISIPVNLIIYCSLLLFLTQLPFYNKANKT